MDISDLCKNCIKEGYLTKQGVVRKSWRKRYFVLMPNGDLYYFKNMKENHFKGKINIRNVSVERADEECKKKFAIKMTSSKRVLFAFADTEKEAAEWLLKLRDISGQAIIVKHPLMNDFKFKEGFENVIQQYNTLSEAIDKASEGEKIFIFPGVYVESQIAINKPVALIGLTDDYRLKESESNNRINTLLSEMKDDENLLNEEQYNETLKFSKKLASGISHESDFSKRYQEKIRDYNIQLSLKDDIRSDHVIIKSYNESSLIFMSSKAEISNIEFQSIKKEQKKDKQKSKEVFDEFGDFIEDKSIPIKQEKEEDIEDLHCSCVEVENGELTLNNCTMNSELGSGVLLMNNAKCNLNQCIIYKCKDVGVWKWDRAQFEMKKSIVLGTQLDCIRTNGEGLSNIKECLVMLGDLHGLCICDRSQLFVEENNVLLNKGDGLRAQNEAYVMLQNDKFHYNMEYGVKLIHNSSSDISNSSVVLLDNSRGNKIRSIQAARNNVKLIE